MMPTEEDSKKLFKRRSRFNLRKFDLNSNRVVDYWNWLSDSCINCSVINRFKSQIKVELEPKMQFQQLLMYDSRQYMA